MPRLLVLITGLLVLTALPAAALPATGASLVDDVIDATDATDVLESLGLPADVAFHDATLLVRPEPGTDRAALHAAVGVGEVVNTLDVVDVDVVAVPSGTVLSAVAAYQGADGVVYAEPNLEVRLLDTPDDPSFSNQYGLARIDATGAWSTYHAHTGTRFASSGGATLAVIDTGIDLLHPEFSGKVVACQSWVLVIGVGTPGCQENNVHGTHVSGIATAITDNGFGIAGVAPDADLMALQAFNPAGTAFTADIVAAITYAASNGADVANYSFGAAGSAQTQEAAVAYAHSEGVLQIAAAGNDGTANSVNYPAKYPEVVAVSSTDQNDRLSGFSSRGPEVDVAAPGSDILSTLPGAGLVNGNLSGTSMASPHVAGLGALLMNLGLDHNQARSVIAGTTDLVGGATGPTDEFGSGRINAAAAVQEATSLLATP